MQIEIRKETIQIHNGKENLSIVHLGDIHVKFNGKKLDAISNYLDVIRPNIVVMTGDYFDLPMGAFLVRKFIQQISREFEVIYITGNHDHYYGKNFSNLITQSDLAYCIDETNCVYHSRNGFKYNFVSKNSVNTVSMKYVNILLLHNPSDIDTIDTNSIALGFAGHLHGGQILLYKDKLGYHYPGRLFYKYCIDRLKILDTTLFITRGLGDTLPIRWNCNKEIVHLIIS